MRDHEIAEAFLQTQATYVQGVTRTYMSRFGTHVMEHMFGTLFEAELTEDGYAYWNVWADDYCMMTGFSSDSGECLTLEELRERVVTFAARSE